MATYGSTLLAVTGNGRLVEALSAVDAGHIPTFEAVNHAVALAVRTRTARKRVFFIGNGGSAAIASHMAADWLKAGKFKAMCFNDPALLTCLSNDEGYERVFSYPLTNHSEAGDLLVAISSSGQSANIVRAAQAAQEQALNVITLSGFKPDNPLRKIGDINFHVPSERYGIVEVAHHAILHAILDRITEA